MAPKSDLIWMNGKLVPWADANLHVMTHTLHYGAGVFEGIRAYKGTNGVSAVFRLEEHVERLLASAKILQIVCPYGKQEIFDACLEVMKANKLLDGYIRPMIYIGTGEGMGVNPGKNPVGLFIAAWTWGAYLGADALEQGIRVKTSSFPRHHVASTMTKAKASGHYINSVLAKREALVDGYDEALMLDTMGFVAEGTGENIFMVKRGKIYTTPLTSAVLDGITRDSIIQLAGDLGYEVIERLFTRDELYVCDEAFFSGTAAEITPIREVDRREIGEGKAGPVCKALQKEFFRVVKGENPAYAKWLTPYTI